MITPPAPYLYWVKSRTPAEVDLAGSNLLACGWEDIPGAREAVALTAANDSGYAPLVEAIAAHYGVEASRVATGLGCSGANFITIAALVRPDDEVLVERPAYDPLLGACTLMGARVRRFDRQFDRGWHLDLNHLAALVTPRCRLIIVTSPHNPSGVALTVAELQALGTLADRVGATVLVDEVYLDAANEVRAHDGLTPLPSAAALDGPFVMTSSLTKSFGLGGLKSGWMIAPDAATAERLRRTRDVIDNAGPAPSDHIAAAAFTHLAALRARAARLLVANVTVARRFFAEHPELELAEPATASVVFPRLRGVADALPFVSRLHRDHGLAVAPGHFFDAPAHFRVSLAGRPEVLVDGLARLARGLSGAVGRP